MIGRMDLGWVVFWQIGSVATFIKLSFFDGYVYNWWNWIIAIPVNLFLGEIWPIYWLVLKPIIWMIHG